MKAEISSITGTPHMPAARRGFAALVVFFLAAILLACGGGGGDSDGSAGSNVTLTALAIMPEHPVIALEGEFELQAIGTDENGNAVTSMSVTWESSDADVVAVDAGRATGLAVGSATITAHSGGMTAAVVVDVVTPIAGKVVAGSGSHACGLTTLGEAWCWGSNSGGQLGVEREAPVNSHLPRKVQGGMLFKDIAPGQHQTCAISMAGKAWCWGFQYYGLLGDGEAAGGEPYVTSPKAVALDEEFVSISSGFEQTCAVTVAGAVYCWPFTPDDYFWSTSNMSGTPFEARMPALFSADHDFVAVDVGQVHACALTTAGAAWCWGYGGDGRLGNGHTGTSAVPVAVSGGLQFATISTGTSHNCALDAQGKAWCWGGNGAGQLGVDDATVTESLTPVAVAGNHRFVSISAGGGFTAAVDENGDLYWWGSYSWSDCTLDDIMAGSMGNCTTYEGRRDAPATIGDGEYAGVSAGGGYGLAVTGDGVVEGWWHNSYGQLGNGSDSVFVHSPYSAPMGYELEVDGRAVVEPGSTVTIPVTVQRTGGFTTSGVGFNETITLSAPYLPSGVTATFAPSTLAPGQSQSMLTLSADDGADAGSTTISVQASAAGSTPRSDNVQLAVALPSTGELDLVCDSVNTPLPYGFHCMDNGYGNIAPGKWNIPQMMGTWVDSDIGLCLEWGNYGYATARFRAPQLGGGATTVHEGIWGVIVRSSGVPEGSETQWYVFTGPADDQTKLLGFDSDSNQIINWNFDKQASCPW